MKARSEGKGREARPGKGGGGNRRSPDGEGGKLAAIGRSVGLDVGEKGGRASMGVA